MTVNIINRNILSDCPVSQKAAELFCAEMKKRAKSDFTVGSDKNSQFCFEIKDKSDSEAFEIRIKDNQIIFSAHRLRGLIYAYSMMLRKSEIKNDTVSLIKDISGVYSPEKSVRGHQIGYRDCNNTYDAWDEETYRKYFLDIMAFGANMYEGIPGDISEQNCIMKMSGNEMLFKTSEICEELDLDMSVWHPEEKSRNDDEAVALAVKAYSTLPKLDAVFVPGGDPGDLMPDALFTRCRKIKNALQKYHPDIKMWISAQAPHEYPDWGEKFSDEIKKNPDFLDGVIFGPNHAMTLPELHSLVKDKYPVRFYPDVTHNVRSEYPVHFEKNDWNYALSCTLSRESINPRPYEYKHLHEITKNYLCGSVSYSDGINDDVNKIIFSACDFDSSINVKEILEDYVRMFMYPENPEKTAECIINLEKNWDGNPEENPQIEKTLQALCEIGENNPQLYSNYRFVMCLFRAECDMLVKQRLIFENKLVEEAKEKISKNDIKGAEEILLTDFPESYKKLRKKINRHADDLNRLIGMQLDVETYHGKSWERGCTLETIDRPVTNRAYLLARIKENKNSQWLEKALNITNMKNEDIYFSFALDTVAKLQPQVGEYYMDFDGDTPKNDGSMPVNLLNTFDHFSLRFTYDISQEKDCYLIVTYKERKFSDAAVDFTVKINGEEIYHGVPYGGSVDEELSEFMPEGFIPIKYRINKELIKNNKLSVLIEEPTRGFLVSEFRIKGES